MDTLEDRYITKGPHYGIGHANLETGFTEDDIKYKLEETDEGIGAEESYADLFEKTDNFMRRALIDKTPEKQAFNDEVVGRLNNGGRLNLASNGNRGSTDYVPYHELDIGFMDGGDMNLHNDRLLATENARAHAIMRARAVEYQFKDNNHDSIPEPVLGDNEINKLKVKANEISKRLMDIWYYDQHQNNVPSDNTVIPTTKSQSDRIKSVMESSSEAFAFGPEVMDKYSKVFRPKDAGNIYPRPDTRGDTVFNENFYQLPRSLTDKLNTCMALKCVDRDIGNGQEGFSRDPKSISQFVPHSNINKIVNTQDAEIDMHMSKFGLTQRLHATDNGRLNWSVDPSQDLNNETLTTRQRQGRIGYSTKSKFQSDVSERQTFGEVDPVIKKGRSVMDDKNINRFIEHSFNSGEVYSRPTAAQPFMRTKSSISTALFESMGDGNVSRTATTPYLKNGQKIKWDADVDVGGESNTTKMKSIYTMGMNKGVNVPRDTNVIFSKETSSSTGKVHSANPAFFSSVEHAKRAAFV